MQLEIYNPVEGQPLPPVEWNFPELKKWLEDGLTAYKGRVYTEDTVKEAKKDAAALRKLSGAIDAKRKEMKARYLEPYTAFEAQAKELTGMIDAQVGEIAAQITAFEEARKAEKLEHIRSLYAEIMGELEALVPYEKIHDKRWLNVTTAMSSIEKEIIDKAESIRAALASIDALGLDGDMAVEVKRVYLDRLDLAAALAEKDRITRERQALEIYEQARRAVEEKTADIPEHDTPKREREAPPLYTVDFRVWATTEQLGMLKAFLRDNRITYGPVPEK